MNKKVLKIITIGAIIIVFIILFINNVCNDSFWSFDFYEIIYLGILIFISFFLTQHYNNERNRKEYILDMVDKLHNLILSINLDRIIADNNRDYFNMEIRNIRNILDLLNMIANKYNIEIDVAYLIEQINEIDSTVAENQVDILPTLNKTIDRHKYNMINKCNAIKFTLMFPDKRK